MRLFHWLCASEIPARFDLRRCGWTLAPGDPAPPAAGAVAIAPVDRPEKAERLLAGFRPPERVLLIGIADSGERARLLRLGFGEVLNGGVRLAELEIRAARLIARDGALPASRHVGPLTLDLLARDGFAAGRPLGLHPREFALLWRLADRPGEPVAKAELLADVWRLAHVPDTNSLAVHVSRLRAKLAVAGLADIVVTVPAGGYALAPPESRPAIPMLTNDSLLSGHTRVGKCGTAQEDSRHELRVPRE